MKEVVCKYTSLRKAIAAREDFKVYPTISVPTNQVIYLSMNSSGMFKIFDLNILRVQHGHIKIEVLEVDAAEACALSREYTVKENLTSLSKAVLVPTSPG